MYNPFEVEISLIFLEEILFYKGLLDSIFGIFLGLRRNLLHDIVIMHGAVVCCTAGNLCPLLNTQWLYLIYHQLLFRSHVGLPISHGNSKFQSYFAYFISILFLNMTYCLHSFGETLRGRSYSLN